MVSLLHHRYYRGSDRLACLATGRAGYTTLVALLSLAVIGFGLTAGLVLNRLDTTQTTQTQAADTDKVSYVSNDTVQIEILGPNRPGGWDYGINGTLCFLVHPPTFGAKYRVELNMPTKDNPQGEVIGASVQRIIQTPATAECDSRAGIRRDEAYNAVFNIPDQSQWTEACPQIAVNVVTDGDWGTGQSTHVANLNRSLLCPNGVPSPIPPTAAPTSVPPSPQPTTIAPTGLPGVPVLPTTRPEASQVDGRVTVSSCIKPELVIVTLCNESKSKCVDVPYNEDTVAEQSVWNEDTAEDRTHLYSYIITQDAANKFIKPGEKYTIRSASTRIQTDDGVKTYTSPSRDEQIVTAPITQDFTIDTGDETCSCAFRAKAYVKDADTGEIVNVLDDTTTNLQNGVSNDLQIAARGNRPLLGFEEGVADTGDLDFWSLRSNKDVAFPYGPYGLDGLAYIRLYAPGYDVTSQICSSFGASNVCPGNLKNYERSNFNSGDEGKDFKGIKIACGTDVEYGWTIKKKPIPPTPSISPAEEETDQPAAPIDRFSHESLLAERAGFGATTTGGQGGEVLTVTSLADRVDNPEEGTLRWALERNEPAIVRFNVNGNIRLQRDISIRSNKTLDGRGSDIVITNGGLDITNQRNIIVANVKITQGEQAGSSECTVDGTGDAIQVRNSQKIWIHRVTLSAFCDGLIDIVNGSREVTVSWSKLEHHNKTMLIGNSEDREEEDVNITATLHHNVFSNLVQRIPRIRFGKVDIYNNYYYSWRDYAVGSSIDAQALVENNIFEPGPNTDDDGRPIVRDQVGDDSRIGFARSLGNLLLNDARDSSSEPERVFNRPYTAQIDVATEALKQTLLTQAGSQPPSFYAENFSASIEQSFDTDLNDDGTTNTTDLIFCISEYGESGQNLVCDINGDGITNAVDYSGVITNLQDSQ